KRDALAGTVGAPAEHNDFLAVGRRRFALVFVRGIHVGGASGELGRASVDALVYRAHAQLMTQLADFAFRAVEQERQAAVGKAATLELPDGVIIEIGQRLLLERQLYIDDFLDLRQKPWIDAGQVMNFFKTEALCESVAHIPDAFGTGLAQLYLQFFAIRGFLVKAVNTYF